MRACVCMRCGAKYAELSYIRGEREYQVRRHMPANNEYFALFRTVDLCPDCQKKLEKWMRGE